MRENISPEERLLKLIRGQKKQDTAAIDKEPAAADATAKSAPATAVADAQPGVQYWAYPAFPRYLSFLNIRKVVWAAFVASCIYLIISFIYPLVGFKQTQPPRVKPEDIGNQAKQELPLQAKPYEFYLEGIRNRQIFSSASPGAYIPEKAQPTSSGVEAERIEVMKDIDLVGIISGDNTQAVIEDKKIQKTYYLTKGQFIGELQVEDIGEGKIILNYKGQRFELYL